MKKLTACIALALAVATCPFARADEEYDQLLKEFEDAQQKWFEKLEKAQEGKEKPVDIADLPPQPAAKFVERFESYAKKHAGKPEAIPALAWLVTAPPPTCVEGKFQGGERTQWALRHLTKDHAAQAEMKDILANLQYATYSADKNDLISLYEKVIAVNKNEEAVTAASFNLAFTLYESSDADEKEDVRKKDKRRAEKLFRKLAKEQPDTDLGKRAAAYIFELEHLQIGMVAPDIVGTDVDGKEIKLSQFRGQVVVLDFWGFW